MYEYRAELVRVIDGDTVRLRLSTDFDVGFYITQTATYEGNFRLEGIDTPEVRGVERPEGLIAKAAITELLDSYDNLKALTYKPDKYGRWLCDLYVWQAYEPESAAICVNDWLIDNGYATVYGA